MFEVVLLEDMFVILVHLLLDLEEDDAEVVPDS